MSTIKLKNIQQTVVGETTQPLKLGGIAEDGSDAKISIDTNGNITFDNLSNTLNLTSGQIKFPATQNASSDANTLDDYEEGTFTPTVSGGTTAGTGTYTGQIGKYTKIGNQVHIYIYIAWSNHTGNGTTYVDGLPFINNNNGFEIPCAYTGDGTGHVSDGVKYASVPLGTSRVYLGIYSTTTGNWVSGRTLQTTGQAIIVAAYRV